MTRCLLYLLLLAAVYTTAQAQGEGSVEATARLSKPIANQGCRELVLGSPVNKVTAAYPAAAKLQGIGGTVRVDVHVNKDGSVANVLNADGEESLSSGAKTAALSARFSPSLCDNLPIAVTGTLIFNYVPHDLSDRYSIPERAAGFSDIGTKSPYFESVLSLTENYRIAFGYADGNFHPEASLSKGDFSHFLRLTIDLLKSRAEVAGKLPGEIELYFPSNPLGLRSSGEIIDLDPRKPYSESVGLLVTKYDIALTNSKREFQGEHPMTYQGVIGYWKAIFGSDAVPVNFAGTEDSDRNMSRGEFALFLHESLFVLTYKVLP